MNNLCADIGYHSLNHENEQLCGDRVEVLEQEDGAIIAVLADGLGSGVKANILSTLTSKIISTMLAAGLRLEDCVETIAETLPICSERGVAYSTFTIIELLPEGKALLIQYDNPALILLRDGCSVDYPIETTTICGKKILRSEIDLQEKDIIITISDGCLYAGTEINLNYSWQRRDIIQFMEPFYNIGFSAKTLATILLDECEKLYAGKPSDDATSLVLRICRRQPVSLMIGPPERREDDEKMLRQFFGFSGEHVVCGGTTSQIVSHWLQKPLISLPNQGGDPNIPPMATLEGVDLVTEGIITLSRVLEYAKDYLEENETYTQWSYQKDGAATLARLLFEQATDINLLMGMAANPAHQQNSGLPINFNIKMRILEELADCLNKMGKHVRSYHF